MTIDYIMLGQRIGYLRRQKDLSQEELAEKANLSREFVSRIETGKMSFSIDVLIEIANALGVSSDDILVDHLKHAVSTADSELHKLLLDCTKDEEFIITQTAKSLKAILSLRGI